MDLEAKCREEYRLGDLAETTAKLVKARAAYTLRETLGVHPETGEVVPIWGLGPDGCESWSQYCRDVLGLHKSEASRLCAVWEMYHVRLGIPEERLQEATFTKLRSPLPRLRRALEGGEEPDPKLIEAVFDPEVSTRELDDALREGVERYRVWWGEFGENGEGLGRDLLLTGPGGSVLCGRLALKRMNGATDEEWERVQRWVRNL